MKYQSLLFIQNIDEDETLRKIFDSRNPRKLFNYLMNNYSDAFDEGYNVSETTSAGTSDTVVKYADGYRLIVNYPLDYCGIEREIKE